MTMPRRAEPVRSDTRFALEKTRRSAIAIAALLVVLAAVAAVSATFLDREVRFYDAGAYVVTAKAIATGLGYRNANLPGTEPQGKYPPGLPYMLAAVWRLYPAFPANLVVMRAAVVACSLLFLAITYRYLVVAGKLTPWMALAVIGLTAVHPLFVEFGTELSAEIPYALAASAALYAYSRLTETNERRWFGATVAGLAAAVLTRSMAVALIVGIVLDAFVRERRRLAIVLAAVGAVMIAPWWIWAWHTQAAYTAFPVRIAANYYDYTAHFATTERFDHLGTMIRVNASGFLLNWALYIFGWLPGVPRVVLVLFLAPPVVSRMLKERRPHDLYCVIASILIVLWPWPLNSRFVLVLSPFLIAYSLEGLEEVARNIGAQLHNPSIGLVVPAVVVIAGIATGAEQLMVARSIRSAPDALRQFHETTEWIRASTEPNAILATASDPAYYLFTDRKTVRLAYPDPFDIYYDPVHPARYSQPEATLAWFREIHACYFITDPLLGPVESAYYKELVESLRGVGSATITPVHASSDGSFVVSRLSDCQPVGTHLR